jgi:hypothetical protein
MSGVRLPELLLGIINTQSPDSVDYSIAHYIMQHTGELDHISVGELAAQCQVSNASISRFCRRIGLEDYLDLQILTRSFRHDAAEKFHVNHSITSNEDFLNESIYQIEQFKRSLDQSFLQKLVHEIHEYKHVAAFGHMQSGNVALNLQHDLSVCRKLIDSSHVYQMQREYIKNAGNDTLILIFSVKGGFFDRLFANGVLLNRQNRPRVYMFTLTHVFAKPPYIDKIIELSSSPDYVNSILLFQLYASLISSNYYKCYCSR